MSTSPANLKLHTDHPADAQHEEALQAEQVEQFLQAHPDFFLSHEHLLTTLHLPQTNDGTLSLVDRQTELVRSKQSTLEQKLHELHSEAQANEYRALQLHRMAVHLVRATQPCLMLEALREQLCQSFDLSAALLYLDPSTATAQTIHHLCPQFDFENNIGSALTAAWTSLSKTQQAHIPRSSNELRQILRRHSLPETGSSAVIPIDALHSGERLGLLLLVKRNPQGFNPDMGKLFLELVGELLAASLMRVTLSTTTPNAHDSEPHSSA